MIKPNKEPELFIREILISDTAKLIEQGMYLQAYMVMLVGIEYLGSFFDDEPFYKAGMSEKRFKKALKVLFPEKYFSKSDILYRQHRGKLIHGFSEIPDIEAKEFYTDFAESCHKLLKLAESGTCFPNFKNRLFLNQ